MFISMPPRGGTSHRITRQQASGLESGLHCIALARDSPLTHTQHTELTHPLPVALWTGKIPRKELCNDTSILNACACR